VRVAGLGDRGRERLVDAVEAVLEDAGEAQHQRQLAALLGELVDDVADRHGGAALVGDREVAARGDAEVAVRPLADAVELVGVVEAETRAEAGPGRSLFLHGARWGAARPAGAARGGAGARLGAGPHADKQATLPPFRTRGRRHRSGPPY